MHTINKYQIGDIITFGKKVVGVMDMFTSRPGYLSNTNFSLLAYIEPRGRKKYKSNKVGTTGIKECARYVNSYFGKNGGGSAWSHNYVTPLVNGYEGITMKDRHGNKYENHMSYNFDAADNFKKIFNIDMLNPTRLYICNMYYSGSPWDYKTRKEGKDFSQGTHTGIVLHDGKLWIVRHNFHGDIMEDPLTDLIGSNYNFGITSISVPNLKRGGRLIPKKYIKNGNINKRT